MVVAAAVLVLVVAVAVLALGGSPDRVHLAAGLAETHDATLVLSAGSILHGHARGITCAQAVCLRPDSSTTAGEARGTAALADEHGWDTIVVATSEFHVNRSRLLFTQCLDDVAVVGTDADPWTDEPLRTTLRELVGMAAGLTVARAC